MWRPGSWTLVYLSQSLRHQVIGCWHWQYLPSTGINVWLFIDGTWGDLSLALSPVNTLEWTVTWSYAELHYEPHGVNRATLQVAGIQRLKEEEPRGGFLQLSEHSRETVWLLRVCWKHLYSDSYKRSPNNLLSKKLSGNWGVRNAPVLLFLIGLTSASLQIIATGADVSSHFRVIM